MAVAASSSRRLRASSGSLSWLPLLVIEVGVGDEAALAVGEGRAAPASPLRAGPALELAEAGASPLLSRIGPKPGTVIE
jgi:hypothetical protein